MALLIITLLITLSGCAALHEALLTPPRREPPQVSRVKRPPLLPILPPGSRVLVYSELWSLPVAGVVLSMGPDTLRLQPAGTSVSIPLAMGRINSLLLSRGKKDTGLDGAVTGILIGGAGGIAAAAYRCKADGITLSGCRDMDTWGAVGGLGFGIMGVIIGSGIEREEWTSFAVQPLLLPEGGGIALKVEF